MLWELVAGVEVVDLEVEASPKADEPHLQLVRSDIYIFSFEISKF